MRIEDRPAQTVLVTAYCECGGQLEFTGETKASWPPLHTHKCDRCGAKRLSEKTYPCFEHRALPMPGVITKEQSALAQLSGKWEKR